MNFQQGEITNFTAKQRLKLQINKHEYTIMEDHLHSHDYYNDHPSRSNCSNCDQC